jgi:hypothetical protein
MGAEYKLLYKREIIIYTSIEGKPMRDVEKR